MKVEKRQHRKIVIALRSVKSFQIQPKIANQQNTNETNVSLLVIPVFVKLVTLFDMSLFPCGGGGERGVPETVSLKNNQNKQRNRKSEETQKPGSDW